MSEYDSNRVLERAIQFAAEAHAGRLDKSGLPEILHPLEVMQLVLKRTGSRTLAAVAVLHDTIEDTSVGTSHLVEAFPATIPLMVVGVTHFADETYGEYVERANRMEGSRLVKRCDVEVNILRPGPEEHKRGLRDRYARALSLLYGHSRSWSESKGAKLPPDYAGGDPANYPGLWG